MQIFADTKYDFLKWRFHALIASAIFVLIGLGLLVVNGPNLGIDFAGGANVILRFKDTVPVDQLRAQIADASIQQYGKPELNSVLLRLPKQETEGDYAGVVVARLNQTLNPAAGTKLDLNFQGRDAITDLLKAKDPDKQGTGTGAHDYYYKLAGSIIDKRSELGIFTSFAQVSSTPGVSSAVSSLLSQNSFIGAFNLLSQESVGPQVGRELQRKALLAILLSTLAMGTYIAIRFDLRFGVAAVAALAHDVLFALAFLAMIGAEFEIITVAAFLMIVGYSINDKVVVSDRVRENLKKSRVKEDFGALLNRSINQTLSRTVLTGGCVVLILISLIVFGGEVINEFSWLLLIGILAGTYSTLYALPAFVLAWSNWASKPATTGPRKVEQIRPEPPVAQAQGNKRAKG